ncbi:MAG: heat-inducible transcriptional repressor HrcA [Candidatus Saganbacteria bacterium]|nr:heat-inducible transcriptional repressor HrcA [Candidatus Saganbacteria bacterium]
MTGHDLDERKQKILGAIVRDYQHTAEPVGSRNLSRKHLPELSPATIRNEMADLEEAGLIMQPHTSAGRIPTDAGYRFYVDRLMKALQPTQREADLISSTYRSLHHSVDEVLHQTAKLLSHTLDYTTVVISHGTHQRIYSAGTSNLLHQPEFRNLAQMEKILELLEEEETLTELVEEYSAEGEPINIKIGSENRFKPIRECSVVVRSFEVNDKPVGGISIIGPTRMYYSKAASLIDCVAKELSRVLSGDF